MALEARAVMSGYDAIFIVIMCCVIAVALFGVADEEQE
jgi:hypothetical protein